MKKGRLPILFYYFILKIYLILLILFIFYFIFLIPPCMLDWCSSSFIHSINKYFLNLYLLADNFSWVSCVPTHLTREALTALCPRISFMDVHSEWLWKIEIVSPSGVKGRHVYCPL